jgi:hypothetical protein
VRPIRLRARGDGPPPLVFHRGAHAPYATRWFGVTSLAGHARNLIASAIAAESIDARDWMRPARAETLLSHVVRVLEGDPSQATLAEAMGRPVWVDFVADTGDDHDVSRAVGRMLFASYAVEENGQTRVLPRGDVLLFGGDTAYPVATGEEIARRLVAPWNDVLREGADADEGASGEEPRRVLLGIAGNHDWYDGLDGFGRLFRRKPHGTSLDEEVSRTPERAEQRRKADRKREAGIVARQLHLDEVSGIVGMLAAAWRSVRALVAGGKIVRPRRLALVGYDPVQDASYWALPLARGLEAWGLDRQLGRLDYRQRLFFAERRRAAPSGSLLFVAPDPALAFGEKHEPGTRMLSACRVSLVRDRILYLTGDMHHYERRTAGGESVHVIAGGGGAFLHGTRLSPSPGGTPSCAYPSAAASRRLVAQVPFKLMVGSAGFILHIGFALVALVELGAGTRGTASLVVAGCVMATALAAMLYLDVGRDNGRPLAVAVVAIPMGFALGLLPVVMRLALPSVVPVVDWDAGVLVAFAFAGALLFGFFLSAIALLGLDHQQAFVVLSHPGFKHFVRLCVHPDGRVEAWTIGKDDPVGPGDAVLIDRFDWK